MIYDQHGLKGVGLLVVLAVVFPADFTREFTSFRRGVALMLVLVFDRGFLAGFLGFRKMMNCFFHSLFHR